MKVHSGDGMLSFVQTVLGLYLFYICCFVAATASNIIPFTSGAPATFAIIMCRVIYPDIHTLGTTFSIIKWCMQLYTLYMMLCSKIYILFYIILCRTIQLSFDHWNQRLDIVLNRGTQTSMEIGNTLYP